MAVGDMINEPGYLFHIHDSENCHYEIYNKDGMRLIKEKIDSLLSDPFFTYLEIAYKSELEYEVISNGNND